MDVHTTEVILSGEPTAALLALVVDENNVLSLELMSSEIVQVVAPADRTALLVNTVLNELVC